MATQTVTLLTDWGNSDHYAAVVRARLQLKIPDVHVVDISHSVPRADIYAAAYMALDAYPYFPEGTIHIVGVDDNVSETNKPRLVRFGHQFIIGIDNGFFTVLQALSKRETKDIYDISSWKEPGVGTFLSRDLFPRVASLLATGRPLEQIGSKVELRPRLLASGFKEQAVIVKDRNGNIAEMQLSGRVLCVDGFGNIITSITKKQYVACLSEYEMVDLRVDQRMLGGRFVSSYQDVGVAEVAFIFLENGFLEISMNRDNAFDRLGVKRGSKVIVRFKPKR